MSTGDVDAGDGPTEVVEVATIEGWGSLDADLSVFGDAVVRDVVVVDGRIVVVGCPRDQGRGDALAIWTSADGVSWQRAAGPSGADDDRVGCVTDIVVTSFGLFAHGFGLLRSDDGLAWEPVGLDGGAEAAGTVEAVFVRGDRVTVLTGRVSLAESTVASLFTTVDGATWERASDGLSEIFDNANVGQAVAMDEGLVAVGASPGGEFVPTATVWTSADGLEWRAVTPRGEGFADSAMTSVIAVGDSLVAVGGDDLGTGLMAAWQSGDGTTWERMDPPAGDVAAEHGFMGARSVMTVDGVVYAAGRDYDAGRAPEEVAALWRLEPGAGWEWADLDIGLVPFVVAELEETAIGFWPPPGWPAFSPVRILTRQEVPASSVRAAGDPPIGPIPAPLVSFDRSQARRVAVDGRTEAILAGPLAQVADDRAGGVVFQRDVGDHVVWWLPAGGLEPVELLVGTEGQQLELEGVTGAGADRTVLYQRRVNGSPQTAEDTLRRYAFSDGTVRELAVIGGWEWSSLISSASGDTAALVWANEAADGVSLIDTRTGAQLYDTQEAGIRCSDGSGLCMGFRVAASHEGRILGLGYRSPDLALSVLDPTSGAVEVIAAFAWDNGHWYPEDLFVTDGIAVISRSAEPDHQTPLAPLAVDLQTGEAWVIAQVGWARPAES
ncbi:MAG: hypothetical protein GY925_03465 [Actinomycetia bacterium]|nr:hypothetical protein [Actinomycetes bacterium]